MKTPVAREGAMKRRFAIVPRFTGVLVLTLLVVPAGAEITGDEPPGSCLDNVTASLRASPTSIVQGQTTTVSWSVQAGNCTVTQSLGGVSVPRSGSRDYAPTSNATWMLVVRLGSRTRTWRASVTVSLPKDEYGRINVTITSNHQAGLLLQAIASPESTNEPMRAATTRLWDLLCRLSWRAPSPASLTSIKWCWPPWRPVGR